MVQGKRQYPNNDKNPAAGREYYLEFGIYTSRLFCGMEREIRYL